MNKIEWPFWRSALIVMLLALVFAVLVKNFGMRYLAYEQKLFEEKKAEYEQAQQSYDFMRQSQQDYAQFNVAFTQLMQTGLFDEQARIKWVDALNDERRKLSLPIVRYQITEQQPFTAAYLNADPAIKVVSSVVTLEVGLLHEGDFVQLLQQLEKMIPGQINISQCELNRGNPTFSYAPERSNLNAVCKFNWILVLPNKEAAQQEGVSNG